MSSFGWNIRKLLFYSNRAALQILKKRYLIIPVYSLPILFASGCTSKIDNTLGHINRRLSDINDMVKQIDVPVEGIEDTSFRIKGRKLAATKTF